MAARGGSYRRRTRKLMKKHARTQGKISLRNYFSKYNKGDKVALVAEPAVQKGIFHLRFYGKHGIVQGMQGKCYLVKIKDGGKSKIMLTHPVHLKRTP